MTGRAFPTTMLLALLLASGLAAAQSDAPRINRNPAFRESLPPAAPLPPDPRDSTTRPATPTDDEGRATVITPSPRPDPRDSSVPVPGIQPPASSPRADTAPLRR